MDYLKTDSIETPGNSLKSLYKLMLIVLGLWLLSFFVLLCIYGKPTTAGEFGDMFGAINTLFSGLAFAGVISAILLQRREFELQREQLKLQRHELELTRGEFREQNMTLKIQRFENTFFHMLSLHNELVESCNYEYFSGTKSEIIFGRASLDNIYSDFKRRCSNMEKRLIARRENITLEHINKEYMDFYKGEQHNLGHYFRNMYNIVKFVRTSSINEKRQYTNLLRAQLSTQELALLFYNCLSETGREKFKPLVEEFALLKNLPEDVLANPEHKSFYMGSAFGR